MSEYATNGAMLVCTCGATPAPLAATANVTVMAQENAIATISDKVPMVNVKPFGTCTMKPSISGFLPCVPAPTTWAGFNNTVQLPGGNPLLLTSNIQCGTGGVISFQNSGQMAPQKVVISPTSPQIEALKKAAIEGTPFCEECEKKKEQKKEKKQPRVTDIYWIDETNDEVKRLSALDEGEEVTLFFDIEDAEVGDSVSFELSAPDEQSFEGGAKQINLSATVEEGEKGLIAIVENFSYKFE